MFGTEDKMGRQVPRAGRRLDAEREPRRVRGDHRFGLNADRGHIDRADLVSVNGAREPTSTPCPRSGWTTCTCMLVLPTVSVTA